MANPLAAIVLDDGQGPVTGFALGGRSDLIASIQRFAESLKSFGTLSVDDDNVFDTDTGPFILAGLPGIGLKQNSPEYEYTHHSAVDTFDKVQPDVLNHRHDNYGADCILDRRPSRPSCSPVAAGAHGAHADRKTR